jgi:uncharacterized protein (DUF305 family)
MNKSMLYGIIGLLVGIVLTGVVARNAVNNQNMGMMDIMGMRSSQNMAGSIDRHFIEQMIPHHDDAITMATIALEKAEHAEIKTLATNIIGAQTAENNQMRQWYKGWYGKDVPDVFANQGHGMGSGMMHGGMMGNSGDIASLETAKPFDKAFIEQMIPHHQMAIMMAAMLKISTSQKEMKQLADNIIRTQSEEIEQMRSWYNIWYK